MTTSKWPKNPERAPLVCICLYYPSWFFAITYTPNCLHPYSLPSIHPSILAYPTQKKVKLFPFPSLSFPRTQEEGNEHHASKSSKQAKTNNNDDDDAWYHFCRPPIIIPYQYHSIQQTHCKAQKRTPRDYESIRDGYKLALIIGGFANSSSVTAR